MQYTYCKDMLTCNKCNLWTTRTKVVPGRGDPSSSLWFVGEAPGREEDETGIAFVGRAGRLLDRCIEKVNITSFNIVNLLKCRPPDNRNPTESEVHMCTNVWLYRQLEEYKPRVIVAMGRFSIGFFRECTWKQIIDMRVTKEVNAPSFKHRDGYIVVPMYHPAYLLRNGEATEKFIQRLALVKRI